MEYDDIEVDLFRIVSEYGTRPDVPIESERFFRAQYDEYKGTKEEFLSHIAQMMPIWFRAVNKRPNWIQDCEWQFYDGRPMLFVGQSEVPKQTSGLHDDASVFTFWDPMSGETKVVIQVS